MDKIVAKVNPNCVVLNNEQSKYEVIRLACKELNWLTGDVNDVWQVYWSDSSSNLSQLIKNAKRFQRINHFFGMVSIYRKSHLAKSLNNMRKICSEEYNFFPNTLTMPLDSEEIIRLSKLLEKEVKKCWIVKPASGSQGRGIFLTFNLNDIDLDNSFIIQEYITNPLLIDGYKFDLRIYVLVVCCEPLRFFIYREGLVRLCTEKYQVPNEENLGLTYMHLTNYAINKNNENFIQNNDNNGNSINPNNNSMDRGSGISCSSSEKKPKNGISGSPKNNNSNSNSNNNSSDNNSSKRSLSWFMQFITTLGQDSQKLWEGIGDVITKTLISAQPTLSHNLSTLQANSSKISNSHQMSKNISEISPFICFELLGFDILITDTFQPILLEVNHSPSFTMDSPLDYNIKSNLIKNTLLLLDAQPTDAGNYFRNVALSSQMRLHGSSFSGMSYNEYKKKISGESYGNLWTRFLQNERVHIGDYQLLYPTNEYINQLQYVPPSFSSISYPITSSTTTHLHHITTSSLSSNNSNSSSNSINTILPTNITISSTTSTPKIIFALNNYSPRQQLYLNLLEANRLRYWNKLTARNTSSLSYLLMGPTPADLPVTISPQTTSHELVEEIQDAHNNNNNNSNRIGNSDTDDTNNCLSPISVVAFPNNFFSQNKLTKSTLMKRSLKTNSFRSNKQQTLSSVESWMRNRDILTPKSMVSLNMHNNNNEEEDRSYLRKSSNKSKYNNRSSNNITITNNNSMTSSSTPQPTQHFTDNSNRNNNNSNSKISLSNILKDLTVSPPLSPQRPLHSKPSSSAPARTSALTSTHSFRV